MGDSPDRRPDVRIGHAERQAALDALNEHFSAGRLTLHEFDERTARAIAAITRAELEPLFQDLPALGTASTAPAVPGQQQEGTPLRQRLPRDTIMALTPFVTLALFIIVDFPNDWLLFLLIPVMGIVLYAGDEDDDKDKGD
ncbi:DUF1707 SHOCT-like domain-containing protein [Lolliginicoccus suaedae]|uniref:DUF1707 SHOCT-like domain-containing protein n=1 Tax=Lolliginicoccus suaedae TaxID=2605429 RepID=UPI0011EE8D67|nr:DUF1707 domain-containing protein [Lolliginicoccus suaedae]